MQQKSWLLPDGIVELTGLSAQKLEHIRRTLLDLYQSWGYSLIFPPLVEYLDNLIAGAGEDLTLQTFKLTDQISGRMLGIRADITPQVARHDAYHNTGQVSRLCYAGSVLHAKASHILANRSLIQAGAELYGHQGLSSDLEIVELLLASLVSLPTQSAVVQKPDPDWTLTIGQAAITRTLLENMQLPALARPSIIQALQNRSEPDLIQIAASYSMTHQQIDQLISLAHLCGDVSILQQVAKLVPTHDLECQSLQDIFDTCAARHPTIRWFFDFSSMNNYTYETGIIFHGTHAQSAEPLARGGRYDDLSLLYGTSRPAVGFSCDLLALAQQTQRTKPVIPRKVWSPSLVNTPDSSTLRAQIEQLRKQSIAVTTSTDITQWQQLDSSTQQKYDGYLHFDGSHWRLTDVEQKP